MRRMRVALTVLFTIASGIAGLQSLVAAQGSISQINHVIVIYQENWSFDGLYGKFPGANGIANAGDAVKQVDKNGVPYATLPQPIDNNQKPPAPDPRFPANLPVAPFDLDAVRPAERQDGRPRPPLLSGAVPDRRRQDGQVRRLERRRRPRRWATTTRRTCPRANWPSSTRWPTTSSTRAFGGSFLNHFWLVCACTPQFPNAPDAIKAQLDANGVMTKDGAGHAGRLRRQHVLHGQQSAPEERRPDVRSSRTRRCRRSATA